MQRFAVMFLVLFVGAVANGQTAGAVDDPAPVLKRMAEQTAEYRKMLPNFTCDENVVSILKQKNKLKLRIEFRASIRVVRNEKSELKETFSVTNYMGKDATKGGRFEFPLYMDGGLSSGMPSFFGADEQACNVYSLREGRMEFASKPGSTCKGSKTTNGFALLDADGNLTHGEFHRDLQEAAKLHFASEGRVDYAPVTLNGQTYRLPSHLYAEIEDGERLRIFEAYYTSCRLFHATATISPAGSAVVPD